MGKLGLAKTACIVFLVWGAAVTASSAQTFTTLHSFDGTDGDAPYAGLVQATNGNLYGTTVYGGTNDNGTIFKITSNGTLTTLYSFCSQTNCADGDEPYAGLVQATNGNLYGTTCCGGAKGQGTVFKITPSGTTLTTLYSFCSQSDCTDGEGPYAGLVQATNGNLYGTTNAGGGAGSLGTVFKVTSSGALTTLQSFDETDGSFPNGTLIQATDGSFYGTTIEGGAPTYGGTVFQITSSGTLTMLYTFCSQSYCADGQYPYAGLVQGRDGNFYGTTVYGGTNDDGTIFKITPSGKLTTLYSFCSQSDCTDGEYPYAGLVQATDGNFYGTTLEGGANDCILDGDTLGCGTIFKITPAGKLTTLHSFDGTDGEFPYADLVQDTNGTFYGTTFNGGDTTCSYGCGTVFSLSVGIGPFAKTLPTSGKVGAAVKILGTNLTGTTSVDFNGTAATFTVVSSTEITTTVPTGATTGTVEVTTPSGTLDSNVVFRVAP
jgi:uncharacterized repeat protein (TIGR03803 family)